jgi:uncharacterized membrane protein YhaH (DUF805 family)
VYSFYKKRLTRKKYWMMLLFVLAILLIFSRIPFVALLGFVKLVMITMGRLNDIGRSRWFGTAPIVPLFVAVWYNMATKTNDMTLSTIAALFMLGAFVYLGCVPSHPDDNRFGGGSSPNDKLSKIFA